MTASQTSLAASPACFQREKKNEQRKDVASRGRTVDPGKSQSEKKFGGVKVHP